MTVRRTASTTPTSKRPDVWPCYVKDSRLPALAVNVSIGHTNYPLRMQIPGALMDLFVHWDSAALIHMLHSLCYKKNITEDKKGFGSAMPLHTADQAVNQFSIHKNLITLNTQPYAGIIPRLIIFLESSHLTDVHTLSSLPTSSPERILHGCKPYRTLLFYTVTQQTTCFSTPRRWPLWSQRGKAVKNLSLSHLQNTTASHQSTSKHLLSLQNPLEIRE